MAPLDPREKRRQLSPEEKWQVFLEVTSGDISQADAARKWRGERAAGRRVGETAEATAPASFPAGRRGGPSATHQA